MNKYEIMTALVKAGCDLDKLPKEILSAIESFSEDSSKLNTEDGSAKARVHKFIAEASSWVEANKKELGYSARYVRDAVDSAMDDLSRGDYKHAYNHLIDNKLSMFPKYGELMSALGELM